MKKKQLFAVLLAGSMTVGMAPAAAFAAEDTGAAAAEAQAAEENTGAADGTEFDAQTNVDGADSQQEDTDGQADAQTDTLDVFYALCFIFVKITINVTQTFEQRLVERSNLLAVLGINRTEEAQHVKVQHRSQRQCFSLYGIICHRLSDAWPEWHVDAPTGATSISIRRSIRHCSPAHHHVPYICSLTVNRHQL